MPEIELSNQAPTNIEGPSVINQDHIGVPAVQSLNTNQKPATTLKSIMYVLLVGILYLLTAIGAYWIGANANNNEIQDLRKKHQNEMERAQEAEKNLEVYKSGAEAEMEHYKTTTQMEMNELKDVYEKKIKDLSKTSPMNNDKNGSETPNGNNTSFNIDEMGINMRDSSRGINLTLIKYILGAEYIPAKGVSPDGDPSGCFTLSSEDAKTYFKRGIPKDSDDYHNNIGCSREGEFAYRKLGEKSFAVSSTMENTENGNSVKPITEYSNNELLQFKGIKGSGKYSIEISQ